MEKKQLELILAYRNEDVLSRFTDQFAVNEEVAAELFTETLKFLYLSQLPAIFIPDELLMLDEMWHNFILFTKEYHAFCNQHFGRYFHHLPATKKEKTEQRARELTDPVLAEKLFSQKLQYLIGATYDHLGEQTVVKWFKVYPVLYSKKQITQLRLY
ncbi:MAG: hypothetical protein ABUM51_02990 [Bacteroidota bacterium]